MLEKQTALLIFTKNTLDEASSKRLYGNNQAKNIQVLNALNKRVQQTVKATKMPYFVLTGNQQVGATFEQRYKNAIQRIFDKGYGNVIVLGNDSPEILVADLLLVKNKLDHHNLVYGATNKGGIYTLGLTRNGFENFDFSKMAWQTNILSKQFDFLNKEHKDIHCLKKELTEFNSQKDIVSFLAYLKVNKKNRQIFGELFQYCFSPLIGFLKNAEKINLFFQAKISLRGPPSFTF